MRIRALLRSGVTELPHPPPPRPELLSEFAGLGGKDVGVWLLPTRRLQGIVGRASQAVEGDNPIFLERTDWEGTLLDLGLTCHRACSERSQRGAQGSSGSRRDRGGGGEREVPRATVTSQPPLLHWLWGAWSGQGTRWRSVLRGGHRGPGPLPCTLAHAPNAPVALLHRGSCGPRRPHTRPSGIPKPGAGPQ